MMVLCSPSYYSLSGETVESNGDCCSHSDAVHNLLMTVRQGGEILLPSELFTNEPIHKICHLNAHASLIAVDILNGYECLFEFASDFDIAQIAQDLEKVVCWHEVPVSIMCTTSSERNHLECISRERQKFHREKKKVELQFNDRQDAQQAMTQKMIKDFQAEIIRLGPVQAAHSHLTAVSAP